MWKHSKAAPPASSSWAGDEYLRESANCPLDILLQQLGTSERGLTSALADERRSLEGGNTLIREHRQGPIARLLRVLANPLNVLLLLLAGIGFGTADYRSGVVILIMVGLGSALRFVQESHASAAAERLSAMVHVNSTVVRDGVSIEIPLENVVRGDIVRLIAGDLIPGDARILECKDLHVNQSALTGESLPARKQAKPDESSDSVLLLANMCFLGTSVSSGTASVLIVATGAASYFGHVSASILEDRTPTSFEQGIDRFTWLMIRFIAVLVPLVFLINGFTKHDWIQAFFFAIAVAVGITPEMLPMIVAVCLSQGAMVLAAKKVIVKQMDAIQNLGAIDVLCTDKTGTLTMDRVVLERHCDVLGIEDIAVLKDAYLVSRFQSGLRSALDAAILSSGDIPADLELESYVRIDEVPFDFSRKMMSVVVQSSEESRKLISLGAPEEIQSRSTRYSLRGEEHELDETCAKQLKQLYDDLSGDGFRVLAVASRHVANCDRYSIADEADLVISGFIAFLDPPKETAQPAVAALVRRGVEVKVLTGDNAIVTRKVCSEVGIDVGTILLGQDLDRLTDPALATALQSAHVCARLTPDQKVRIIRVLRDSGHVVGYLGDGINDAPALRAADVGISVDTAVDVAKEAADLILLEKSLLVLHDGVYEGRRVFTNIHKYIRMGASSNIGNMLSVVGASAFLPFLPMAPIQVLTNNLLYDLSQVPIPGDRVDAEELERPRPWSTRELRRYILLFGPLSALFDYTTFAFLLYVFNCWNVANASLFQTGWFIESLVTQTLIIHVTRTNKIPFLQSRSTATLLLTGCAIVALGSILPYTPLAGYLGFVTLPPLYWLFLIATVLAYLTATQLVKMYLLKRAWV